MSKEEVLKKVFVFVQYEKELHEDFFDRVNEFLGSEEARDFEIVHTSIRHPEGSRGWEMVFVVEYYEEVA